MIIHDDIYSWKGWGGKLKLASGKCRLQICDLKKGTEKVAHFKPIIVIVSDVPESRMSVRSCAAHIATSVTKEFNINPNRMLWVEYYPEKSYGMDNTNLIPERYDSVEFTWREDKAIKPKWRPLNPNMLETVKAIIQG